MNFRLLFFGLILSMCLPRIQAQDIDVTQLTADTKTFIFSNNKNTVKGYIYAELEEKTACCGSDRIYLEVRIDPSGYVTQAKTLTGKNDCFKQSAIDIVKNVKWNAKDFKREKSVYFEIKPNVDCDGAKANNYAQIEIFNNELLDKEGNRVYASAAPARTETPAPAPAAATTPDPGAGAADKPATDVAATNIATPPSRPPGAAPARTETNGPAGAGANQTPVADKPVEKVAETTAPTASQPIASAEGPSRSSGETPTPTSESDFVRAKERVELERNVQDEEVRILREKMEEMRAREDEARAREKELQEEKARKQREREERERQRQQEEGFAGSEGEGGLFFDESASTADQGGDGIDQGGPDRAAMDEEQRARDDIARLEQQMRDIESRRRERDNQLRQQEREDQLAAQEMIRIQEEILRRQDDMEQRREQQELDRIEQDRRRAEEEQRKYEEEIRRMMDEMARLQAESERKMQDLERQKQEMERLAALRIQREQEMALQAQIREKEREAELERLRIAANAGTSTRNITSTAPSITAVQPTFTFPAGDSASKLDMILMQMSILQQELQRVQFEMQQLRSGAPVTPLPQGGTPRGVSGQRPGSSATPAPTGGAKNAAQDRSWQKIDNGVSGPAYNASAAPVDPTRFHPVRGYSPEANHAGSFVNTEVNRFPSPTSGQGQGNMKNYIKEELRKTGVCGLAQALAEITISPSGDVSSYRIIKASSIQVNSALPGILTGMKFESSNLDVPYVSYIEFKAEILCEGMERINIRDVEDYIETDRP